MVHWTFFLLIGWIFTMHMMAGRGPAAAAMGVVFILTLFGCVVLHELGHALAARRYGVATRDITLLPIGGVARLERIPRNPTHELVVALAGPAVNVAIAVVISLGLLAAHKAQWIRNVSALQGNFFVQLMAVNIFLVAFNLIPAFPMDGGRVLRALLARRMNYARATMLAARIGQGMAVLLGVGGVFLLGNPMMLLVALFVFFGARTEAGALQVTDSLTNVQVQDAMMTNFRVLNAEDPLAVAAEELIHGSQQDFPVTDGEQVVGILTRADLVAGLAQIGPERRVREVMRPNCAIVSATDHLEKPYEMLRGENCSTVPVVREGHLVGMITLENILEWVMINTALRQRSPA
ncbi:MAG TPA: site-2 protease family protein [Candidatus Binatia bacterium]|nr:site-2 protease family protein [Candidatus Binatia bacterium]